MDEFVHDRDALKRRDAVGGNRYNEFLGLWVVETSDLLGIQLDDHRFEIIVGLEHAQQFQQRLVDREIFLCQVLPQVGIDALRESSLVQDRDRGDRQERKTPGFLRVEDQHADLLSHLLCDVWRYRGRVRPGNRALRKGGERRGRCRRRFCNDRRNARLLTS